MTDLRTTRLIAGSVGVLILFALSVSSTAQSKEDPPVPELKWKVHSKERPTPPRVDPGAPSVKKAPPDDATVLFDGSDLSSWISTSGGPAGWTVENGFMEVSGSDSIQTREKFGDVQLHVEWSIPDDKDHGHGNSGVYLMSRYEIQVLKPGHPSIYPDGMVGAVYGQYPPLVNAGLPPGKWQSYDIIFHGPRFRENGDLERPASVTVFLNGVLVHDHAVLTGPTGHKERPPYEPHPEKQPLLLQNHNDPVRYRNIWVRELND